MSSLNKQSSGTDSSKADGSQPDSDISEVLDSPSEQAAPCRHFIIILTNHPQLLEHTEQYRQLHEQDGQLQQAIMLMQDAPMNAQAINIDTHEGFLYNSFKFELQEATRAYLHRTRRLYPIYFVFNMSNIEPQQ